MLKDFLWEAFIVTGNIETYVFLKEVECVNEPIEDLSPTPENLALVE